MLCIIAWAIAHCNVCIDPKKPKFTEKPAISDLIFITKSINKINILHSHIEEKYWNFKLKILVCVKLVLLELPSLKNLFT